MTYAYQLSSACSQFGSLLSIALTCPIPSRLRPVLAMESAGLTDVCCVVHTMFNDWHASKVYHFMLHTLCRISPRMLSMVCVHRMLHHFMSMLLYYATT